MPTRPRSWCVMGLHAYGGDCRQHQEHGLRHGAGGRSRTLQPGKLADVIILKSDPLADIRILQGSQHLATVIKDGKIVPLNGHGVGGGDAHSA